jgi:hypothetical protein
MSKKLDPMEDPKYFEYEPKMLEDDEDEIHLSMYELGVKPEDLPNQKDRKKYQKWLKENAK